MPKCRQLKNNLNKGAKYGECVFGLHPQGVNAQQCILNTYSLMLRKLNLDEREHWPFKLFPFLSLKPSLIYEKPMSSLAIEEDFRRICVQSDCPQLLKQSIRWVLFFFTAALNLFIHIGLDFKTLWDVP